MQYLTVIYDEQCGLCTRLSQWLHAQPKWIGIRLVPSQSAGPLYPALADRIAHAELVVVTDEGGVYWGNHSWLICLYALKHYRHWAQRLSGPALLPLARQAFAILSSNRRRVSKLLRLLSDDELALRLGAIQTPRCHGNGA